VLLPLDKQKGENPLQVKTIYFFAPKVAGGAGAVGFLFMVVGIVTRKKKAPAPPPAA
jgi:hypothetical protein